MKKIIVISIIAIVVVIAYVMWPRGNNDRTSDGAKPDNGVVLTSDNCAGYYLWNRDPNETQANILRTVYDLETVKEQAVTVGYRVSEPTPGKTVLMTKQLEDDEKITITLSSVSLEDDRQRVTAVLTSECRYTEEQVKQRLADEIILLRIEQGWIESASILMDRTVDALQ